MIFTETRHQGIPTGSASIHDQFTELQGSFLRANPFGANPFGTVARFDYSEESLPDNAMYGTWDHHEWSCFPGTAMCTRMYKTKYALTKDNSIAKHSTQKRNSFEDLKAYLENPGGVGGNTSNSAHVRTGFAPNGLAPGGSSEADKNDHRCMHFLLEFIDIELW